MGMVFRTDLVVLGFKGFDLILGMDWLSQNHATLECASRTITLQMSDGQNVQHNCTTPGDSVMTSVLYSMESSKNEVQDIEVVRRFPGHIR